MHEEPAATNPSSESGRIRPALSRAHRYAVLALALCLAAGLASLAVLSAPADAEECPNAAFRTGPSSHLPDCRAYEMVTPPYKDAGFGRVQEISPSGLSLQLAVNGGFAGIEGYPNIRFPLPGATYTTRRTDAGWVSTSDDPPTSEYLPYLKDGLDSWGWSSEEGLDNQVSVWMDRGVWEPGNRVDFFMRRSDRSIVDIGPALPPTAPSEDPEGLGEAAKLNPVGLSPNGTRYFFTIRKYFWSFDGTEEGNSNLYEYLGTDNTTPLLVGVNDSGAQISQCGTLLGSSDDDLATQTVAGHNAISADGNTVFFTAYPHGNVNPQFQAACQGNGPKVAELFARIDNGLPGAHTVAISEPSKEDCSACDTETGVLAGARFEGASEDGSKVFFTTTQPLLGGDASNNIYEYDFDAPDGERVFRVSAGDATVSNPAPGLLRTKTIGRSPFISEDGSHVYFIAAGVLTKVPNGEAETAESDARNLYVFEHDSRYPHGHIAFVATLSAEDLSIPQEARKWSPDTSPDGRFLVFASDRDLTPDDTSTARQIFEYDAQTGALVRVSVGQDGFNHNGNVAVEFNKLGEEVNGASIVSPANGISVQSQNYSTNVSVSADGSYVFFQSTVGLTPQALDRKVGATDSEGDPVYVNNVYEYHAGRVSLISDGQDVASSGRLSVVELLGADASGSDVFFQTVDRLVGQDTDTNLDIYDARIDGGFTAPAPPPSCSGDACQGPLGGAPTLLSSGSEFQAGGNPPLAGEPTAKPKPKQKAKAKRRGSKGGKSGKGRARRRGKKARGSIAGARVNRKAGRS